MVDPKNTLETKSQNKLKKVDFMEPTWFLSSQVLTRLFYIIDDELVSSMVPIEDRDLRHSIVRTITQ